MLLLLIEDEKKLTDALSYILKKNGYTVDVALDGETGLEMVLTGIYDVIVLDRMLPGRDGLSILKRMRSNHIQTPVIFLTAKDTVKDRIEGLDSGADDYLVKPFSMEELLARLRALMRRKEKDLAEDTLSARGFTFNPKMGEVKMGDQVIRLTVKESLLLELLMRNYGKVQSKICILEKVWGFNADIDEGNIDLYIHYLRKKLNSTCIKTVRGLGYCFKEDDYVS
ncbi:response regulator transcription factor [Candidatus Formimonas warabiya]|uniref:Stage 0 sporulation protein A homolog n=1 Tax=Formimonas warabiya TaxID=1761012 RepID=A0A3G1KX90_FORW1|nr:response regulator transcription factor [Candidatus Formimonas warabiya]ATW27062.1 DNA-binding response regulator [Candidatus Formimonas warabiya]